MFQREELKAIRTEFWTVFGNIMKHQFSETGIRVRWTNYRTGVKDFYFRLDADGKKAAVYIDFQHADPEIRNLFWEQMEEYKTYFHSAMESEWNWEESIYLPDGREISRISKEIKDVSLFDKNTWPTIFEFFKTEMIRLDSFWSDVRLVFIELSK